MIYNPLLSGIDDKIFMKDKILSYFRNTRKTSDVAKKHNMLWTQLDNKLGKKIGDPICITKTGA